MDVKCVSSFVGLILLWGIHRHQLLLGILRLSKWNGVLQYCMDKCVMRETCSLLHNYIVDVWRSKVCYSVWLRYSSIVIG